jgi:Cdc6-like AAA superfamily ATPase
MPTRTGSAAPAVLLERDAELSMLVAALGAVERTSRGQILLVGGEAGVGKTTLVRQFCDERGRSARVLRGRLQPSEVATSGGSAPRRA